MRDDSECLNRNNRLDRTLVCCDAAELMERLPSGSVDMVFINPMWEPTRTKRSISDDQYAKDSKEHLSHLGTVIQQSHRALSDTGSLVFYSTPHLAGSFRFLLDQAFGQNRFCAEIVIPTPARIRSSKTAGTHDTILWYSKTKDFTRHRLTKPLSLEEVSDQFSRTDDRGPYRLLDLTRPRTTKAKRFAFGEYMPHDSREWRFSQSRLKELEEQGRIAFVHTPSSTKPYLKQYFSELDGLEIGSIWDDISPVVPRNPWHVPGQLAEWILERVISMSTNEGDLIADPFCGSGTSIFVAERLKRRWVACDNEIVAVSNSARRLNGLVANGKSFVKSREWLVDNFEPNVCHRILYTGFEGMIQDTVSVFQLGQPLIIEETRHYEFKEVKGEHPVNVITNAADEYAVAFLNSEGGRIFWGVRDSDRCVVGVSLHPDLRDDLRKRIGSKLNAIKPQIDPTQYRLLIHEVQGALLLQNLVVVELVIPRVHTTDPYYTGGDQAFVRLDGTKQRLSGPQLTDWIRRRLPPVGQ